MAHYFFHRGRRFVLGLALLVCIGASASAAPLDDATRYADTLGNEVLAIIGRKDIAEDEKQNKLRSIFQQNVDVNWIGKFVLGKHWRQATPEQQQQYIGYYGTFLINNYTSKFKHYTGETFHIAHAQDVGDGEYLLSTEIIRPGAPKVLVDYRVCNTPKGFRIYDIVVEGVSLINTQRSEFSSVINRKGVDYLILQLAKKVAAQAAVTP